MDIIVNGKPKKVTNVKSIFDLLTQMGIDPERVAVELNRQVIVRSDLENTVLSENDEIEIVQFVGGG